MVREWQRTSAESWPKFWKLGAASEGQKTSLVAQMVKRLPTMRETRVQSLGREDLLAGKSHGWKSLVGYNPRCRKESRHD